MKYDTVLWCVFFICSLVDALEEPVLETTHGKVSGKVFETLLLKKQYYGFMGIPYAAPPTKELRFLPPQPIESWSDVLRVTKEKRACVQYNNNVKKGQPFGQYGVEDCLYLDIFTPSLHNQLPVIVFLYNEHFRYSYNKTKDYAPDFFIENEVVIATISHRLSVFGFLSLEDDVLSGNSGLKDIVAGLEWIRNNIERFGGDPERITLMGSQGGAAAVDLLIHSKAKGLFKAAILQGGTSFFSMYLQGGARDRAFKMAEILERPSRSSRLVLKDLNNAPSQDLLYQQWNTIPVDYGKEQQRGILAFGPIVEKDPDGLLTRYPEESDSIDIPIMIGINSRQGLEASLEYLIEPNFMGARNKDFGLIMPIRVNYTFKVDSAYDEAIEDIKHFYFSDGVATVNNVADYVTYITDIMNFPVDYSAKFYSKISSANVYYYHFDYYSELNDNKNDILKLVKVNDGTYGAASGDELCYLFKCPSLTSNYLKNYKSNSDAFKVQQAMIKLWTNFAKYGNPTPDEETTLNNLKWPSFDTNNKEYLNIGRNIEVSRDLYEKRFEFWQKFVGKWSKKAVNYVVSEKLNDKEEL